MGWCMGMKVCGRFKVGIQQLLETFLLRRVVRNLCAWSSDTKTLACSSRYGVPVPWTSD